MLVDWLASCVYSLYVCCYAIGDKNDFALLSKCSFVMIKYSRKGRSMPHERVFKMDFENLV